ncbi:MAG: PEP-CTERM sorting domain-containing protein [Tepidisphaerales bacterium]
MVSNKRRLFVSLAAAWLGSQAAAAYSAPLIYVWLEGRVVGSGQPYSTTVPVSQGATVEYHIMAQVAPLGSVNAGFVTKDMQGNIVFHPAPVTVTQLVPCTGPGTGDGINSLMVDIYQDPNDPIQAELSPVTLNPDPTPLDNDGWDGSSYSRGTTSARLNQGHYADLLGIWAIHQAGIFTAISAEVVASGTFYVPEIGTGQASQVRLRGTIEDNQYLFGCSINNHVNVFATSSVLNEEYSPDPRFGVNQIPPGVQFSSSYSVAAGGPRYLELVAAPEPATGLLVAGMTATMLLRQRRRRI